MIKTILYWIEKFITSLMIGLASLGLFLVVLFVAYIFAGSEVMELSYFLAILFGSVLVVLGLDRILLNVRYRRLEIEADELEEERELRGMGGSLEESIALYEHLKVK